MNTGERRAFTLIELLVVISIIGLLSSVAMTSLQGARIKARDTQRIAQANQFAKALQIYFTANGTYPCANSTCSTVANNFLPTSPGATALVASGAIAEVSFDPSVSVGGCTEVGGYCYCSSGGDSYVFTVNTEDDTGGSVRCRFEQGPNTAALCPWHVSTYATDFCSSRF